MRFLASGAGPPWNRYPDAQSVNDAHATIDGPSPDLPLPRGAACRSIGPELTDTPRFERFPYPRRLVVGLFGSEQDLQHAVEALEQVGFDSDSYEVLQGEEDARSLDPEGTAHGFAGRLIRALQEAISDERDHARRYAAQLQDGGYVLGVFVGVDEDAKGRAGDAIRAHGGEFINYYADTYIESL